MRFVWPAERYDRLTRKAAALSVAVTAAGSAALSLRIGTIYRAANGVAAFRADDAREVVMFVHPESQERPSPSSRIRSTLRRTQHAGPSEKLLNSDTGAAGPAPRESGTKAGGGAVPGAPDARPEARDVGPIARPVGIVRPPVVGAPPPRWRWLPPTQAERDSVARELERRMAEARDQHRPVTMPLGGASLPLPFLSRGPSREERARDSVVHAENLARLARLAERARAKRDSLNAASKVACQPSDPRRSC